MTAQATINRNLILTFESLKLSKQWKREFKKEGLGAEMIAADERTILILKQLKDKIMLHSRFKNKTGKIFKIVAFVGLPNSATLLGHVEVLDEEKKVTSVVTQEYIREGIKVKRIEWL